MALLPMLVAALVLVETPGAGGDDAAALRSAALEALRRTCGQCHDSSQPKARPAALAKFDLADPEWASRLLAFGKSAVEGRYEPFKMPMADRPIVTRWLDAVQPRPASDP